MDQAGTVDWIAVPGAGAKTNLGRCRARGFIEAEAEASDDASNGDLARGTEQNLQDDFPFYSPLPCLCCVSRFRLPEDLDRSVRVRRGSTPGNSGRRGRQVEPARFHGRSTGTARTCAG